MRLVGFSCALIACTACFLVCAGADRSDPRPFSPAWQDINQDGVINVLDVHKLYALGAAANGLRVSGGIAGVDDLEVILIEGMPPIVQPGKTFSLLVKLSNNDTELFGYSIALRAVGDSGASGTVTAKVAGTDPKTNFFDPKNLIKQSGKPFDNIFSVILPWNPNGAFISANTADLSTVLAEPDVNDVLAQVFFTASADAKGTFTLELGPATALSDGSGFAVPFDFVGGEVKICALADVSCTSCVDVDDLLALINNWGECVVVPADIDGNKIVDVDDLLVLINSWGQTLGPADLDQNGIVDVDDLVALINAWGTEVSICPDFDKSGTVDVDDLLVVINAWGCY